MPIVSLLIIAFMVFAVVDIIRVDESQVKHLPKWVWLLLVIMLSFIGSVLWFIFGREYPEGGIQLARPPLRERSAPRMSEPVAPASPVAPIDTRTTEQQIADLDREIEEWRLRQEIAKRKRERGEATDDSPEE